MESVYRSRRLVAFVVYISLAWHLSYLLQRILIALSASVLRIAYRLVSRLLLICELEKNQCFTLI